VPVAAWAKAAIGATSTVALRQITAATETKRAKGCTTEMTRLIIKEPPPSKDLIIGNPLSSGAFLNTSKQFKGPANAFAPTGAKPKVCREKNAPLLG
jgi:hypothetical protein